MDQGNKINNIAFDGVINVKRKRSGFATRIAMRSDMVAALPFDNFSRLFRNPLEEGLSKARRNPSVSSLRSH